MSMPIDPTVFDFVRQTASNSTYAAYLRDVLIRLVSINTAAEGDPARIAESERRLFDLLEQEIASADPTATVRRIAIDPAIADHPDYTLPAYARDAAGQTLSAEQVYAGRYNLVAEIPGAAADEGTTPPLVLNAHVDVVPPWFEAREEGGRIFGRGTSDNKAQVAMLLAQIKLLRDLAGQTGRPQAVSRRRVYQFVIDEEIGGNGTLSLARDPQVAGSPVIVHEPTGLRPYVGHRGCLYYQCRLSTTGTPEASALEMFPFAVLAMEKEGRKLREESKAPMFSPAHVQMNQGMLGHYGSSPGSVCDRVSFEISVKAKANPERIGMKLIEFFDEALAATYLRLHDDKTRQNDPASGKPRLARHFDVHVTPGPEYHCAVVHIYGIGGHMAALPACDNAITKAACVLAAMIQMSVRFPGVKAFGRLFDEKGDIAAGDPRSVPAELILQGGQGFIPSHDMEGVKLRLAAAAVRGVQKYCQFRRIAFKDEMVRMSFDLLHNDACAASPDSEPVQAFQSAFAALGESWPAPAAWESSCDARIYQHQGSPVAIFGPGRLDVAHGPDEHVEIADLQKGLAISTLATLAVT